MYNTHTGADYRRHLGLPDDYTVDGVLIYGTWDLQAEEQQLPTLRKVLDELGAPYTLSKLRPVQVGHGYELRIDGRLFWFVPVMGTAVLAQYLHIACLLGSRLNLLLGIVGGLAQQINTGDFIICTGSQGNDNARYYDRTNVTGMYEPDTDLTSALVSAVNNRGVAAWAGVTTTCEMMLAESQADIDMWAQEGYLGVEMEGALTFAISEHFGLPSAALFYVADNLVKQETMLADSYLSSKQHRQRAQEQQYLAGLQVLRKRANRGR